MVLADDVGGNDELPLWMLTEILQEYLFVGLPRTAGHKHRRGFPYKLFHNWQHLGLLHYLQHTVEAGVARDVYIGDTDAFQQFAAHLVLHEETGEAFQHTPILPTIPAEEHLARTEDAAHAVGGHTAMFQDMEVVVPELILDEERHAGTHQSQEAARVAGGIKRQIADDVGSLVVLAHLIARWREECQQNLILWVLAT